MTVARKHLTDLQSTPYYHVMNRCVLRVNKKEACEWSTREVVRRWCRIYSGPPVANRYLDLETLSASELYIVNELARIWRERLYDISSFMGRLNYSIARQANTEDTCRGRLASRPREFHPQPLPKKTVCDTLAPYGSYYLAVGIPNRRQLTNRFGVASNARLSHR